MPKQSSTTYYWLTPGHYKDKVKTSAINEVLKYAVKIHSSKCIPFTFDRHICDLPQHLQVKKPCTWGIFAYLKRYI